MSGPLRCAFCHGDGPDQACAACKTTLHAACWADAERCPTLGCAGQPRPATWLGRLGAWLLGPPEPPRKLDAAELTREGHEELAAGNLPEAGKALERALSLDPDFAPALYWRAHLRRDEGDHAGSIADARRVLSRAEGTPRPRRGGPYDVHIDDPEWRARAWLLVGQGSEALGDEVAADAAFAQVEEVASAAIAEEDFVLHQPRATARLARWDLAGGLADLQAGYSGQAAPEQVATLLRQLGRFDDALAHLERVAAEDSDQASRFEWRFARWQLLELRSDERATEALTRLGPRGSPAAGLLRGIHAALRDDLEAARVGFANARKHPGLAVHAWHWAVSLRLEGPDAPPECADPWQQAITQRLLGRLDDDELVALARAPSGPRARAVRLHEAHVALALVAAGAGDRERELRHLGEAAARGDHGGYVDVWVHARARRLGAPVPHRPPRPEPPPRISAAP